MPRTKIIVVEDSFADFAALSRALKSRHYLGDIKQFETGEDLLDSIQELDFSLAEKVIILIDINLPGISGHDLLKKVHSLDNFQFIPKIFLTSSDDPKDIEQAYKNGANSYLKKPSKYDDYLELSDLIIKYWLNHNNQTNFFEH